MTGLHSIKLIALVLYLLLIPDVHSQVLRYAALDYCPYMCNSEEEGFALTIHRRIFEDAGFEVQVTFLPWARVIYGVETGRYDATPMVNRHHSELIVLTQENSAILQQNFYVKKGNNWRYRDINSLEGLFIGNVIGYNYKVINPDYETYCQENKNTGKVQYTGGVDATEKNIRKLLSGRIDTFNEDAGHLQYVLHKIKQGGQLEEAGILGLNPQYGGFSPSHPDANLLADIFDQGMKRLRSSGELQQILEAYGINDWAESSQID